MCDARELTETAGILVGVVYSCTRLRYVETSLGCVQPSPKSHVRFSFPSVSTLLLLRHVGFNESSYTTSVTSLALR